MLSATSTILTVVTASYKLRTTQKWLNLPFGAEIIGDNVYSIRTGGFITYGMFKLVKRGPAIVWVAENAPPVEWGLCNQSITFAHLSHIAVLLDEQAPDAADNGDILRKLLALVNMAVADYCAFTSTVIKNWAALLELHQSYVTALKEVNDDQLETIKSLTGKVEDLTSQSLVEVAPPPVGDLRGRVQAPARAPAPTPARAPTPTRRRPLTWTDYTYPRPITSLPPKKRHCSGDLPPGKRVKTAGQ